MLNQLILAINNLNYRAYLGMFRILCIDSRRLVNQKRMQAMTLRALFLHIAYFHFAQKP